MTTSNLIFVEGPKDGDVLTVKGVEPPIVKVPIFYPPKVGRFNTEVSQPLPVDSFTYKRRTLQIGFKTIYVYLPESIADGDVMHVMRRTRSGIRILQELNE
jgi:hypothetical protein